MHHIRVLESFGNSRPTTNPYITMLGESLESTPELRLMRFSWKKALTANYDVIHFHWPEALLDGSTWLRRRGKDLAFALLLLRIRLKRIAVVRTVHNLDLPQGLSFIRRQLVTKCDHMTTLRISINPTTPPISGVAQRLIPHGHYCDWFADMPRHEKIAGRIAFAGLIRRYKGVENLLTCFMQTANDYPELSLSVTGKPSSTDLENVVRNATSADDRISFSSGYVAEKSLVAAITEAELVVLPYQHMHNSGSALAALSVQRPVLVPRNETNELLSLEVGAGWVYLYEGQLSARDLTSTLADLRRNPPAKAPDLSARDWSAAGNQHRDAFLEAQRIETQK